MAEHTVQTGGRTFDQARNCESAKKKTTASLARTQECVNIELVLHAAKFRRTGRRRDRAVLAGLGVVQLFSSRSRAEGYM